MDKLFSTKEAAEYLGLHIQTLKHHIYKVGDLRGRLLGKSLVFTQEELDQFKQVKRPPGPHKKEKV